MPLMTKWSEEVLKDEHKGLLNAWGESVAYYMMFTGTHEITDAKQFAFRWILWDVAVHGDCEWKLDFLTQKMLPFVGTTANVAEKTFHTFLNGDVKRIAKEKGLA